MAERLRQLGWIVVKGTTFGTADLVALRPHAVQAGASTALLIEVKSTAGGPYERFGPADRQALKDAARASGARATLAWWPPRKQLKLLDESEWPG